MNWEVFVVFVLGVAIGSALCVGYLIKVVWNRLLGRNKKGGPDDLVVSPEMSSQMENPWGNRKPLKGKKRNWAFTNFEVDDAKRNITDDYDPGDWW